MVFCLISVFHGHENQYQATGEANEFARVIKSQCSKSFHLMVCYLYAPPCTILEEPIPPCRDICLAAKAGCESTVRGHFGFWPNFFDCNRFPVSGLCIGDPNATQTEPTYPEGGPTPQFIRPTQTATTTEASTPRPSTGYGYETKDCKCDCSCTCPRK